jgi:cytochrome c nitrite reductase small subunit
MKDNYAAWRVSSHRTVACNDCHVPHSFVRKWYAKAENGFRHSWAFTFENVQRLRITPADLRRLQENCVRCHAPFVDRILMTAPVSEMSCTTCHRATGHAE